MAGIEQDAGGNGLPSATAGDAASPALQTATTGETGRRTRNRRTAIVVASLAAGMLVMSFAAVPLYRLYCQVTGLDGTTNRATGAPLAVSGRTIRVRFDASVDPALPWAFQPEQRVVKLRIGEQGLAFYRAKNLSDRTLTGVATYNVTPDIVGKYFKKIQCFCFNQQELAPHQEIDMPVIYFVDPAILSDPTVAKVPEITLSYTFFSQDEPRQVAQGPAGGQVN